MGWADGERLSENPQAKTNRQKKPKRQKKKKKTTPQTGFLRLAMGWKHNFNHILPSVGWGSLAAPSVGLAGTILQLEVSDSNDNSYCREGTKCELKLKILGPSMLKL